MTSARVLSLQVGRAAALPWRGRAVPSAIDKRPVDGRIALAPLGFAGDEQADLRVHGGPDKAVCCYPSEHFPRWAALLERDAMPFGAFGENLTLAGALETDVCIGDTYTLGGEGGAVVQVSQPRGPCFKIAARWGRKAVTRTMAYDMIAGFYLRVLEPGTVGAGDTLDLVERVSDVTVAEVLRVTYRDRHDPPALQRVVAVGALAEQWRASLAKLVELNMLPLTDPVGDA
ncbi:Protein YiiM [Baekduia alba]|uniref:MOSC domain-containing protein n=1 Tax=Baekduia alba TaxID=2997333 RepID=UPI002341DE60|nr:MOSC domain-containing protein [Baekduia alba]WCB94301.1 Protein YiiM [Baekduia alba]